MKESSDLIIKQTQYWIHNFVLKLKLCPFAKRELMNNTVRYQLCTSSKIKDAFKALESELQLLDKNPAIETTFLIFPMQFQDFFDYLDFVADCEDYLEQEGYEARYQLASFHPAYCFADTHFDEVSNYSNRSPYPMLHLLREKTVEQAVKQFGDTEKIPIHNIAILQKLGIEEVKRIIEYPQEKDLE